MILEKNNPPPKWKCADIKTFVNIMAAAEEGEEDGAEMLSE